MSDIDPSDYYDVVGEDARRADSEKMWLRRGIQIGREADTLEATRRVAGFTNVTTTERDLLEHGVKLGEASKTTPSLADWSEESIDRIYRERI